MKFDPSSAVQNEFFEHLVVTHSLGHDGFHGQDHWLRVLQNGRELSAETGANLKVVELFSILHDSQRRDENHDPEHGPRAAIYARSLRGTWFDLSDREMDLLHEACFYHSDGLIEADITVQTCWDSDRLDLARVGVIPQAKYLCTTYAKRKDVIERAMGRSRLWLESWD